MGFILLLFVVCFFVFFSSFFRIHTGSYATLTYFVCAIKRCIYHIRLEFVFAIVRSLMVRWVVGSILHGVDPLSYFSFQSVLYDWCNKGRGMYYPVRGMMHIKEPLLLIGKSSPCSGVIRFPISLSEWSFIICPTPYNSKIKSVECVVK